MPTNRQWLEGQLRLFSERQSLYEQQAACLRGVLEHVTRQLCPEALIQVRIKSVQSFAEKSLRKRDKYADPVNQFTDLCAGRVITNLRTEAEATGKLLQSYFIVDEANSLDTAARLRQSEFGYRSIHYVVQFRPKAFPSPSIPVAIPENVYRLKAEVQVRTLLQHAWASVNHSRVYVSPLELPDALLREQARLAAAMESADDAYCRFASDFNTFEADYGNHVDAKELRKEINTLRTLRSIHPRDERLAHQLARLLLCAQKWDALIDLGSEFPDPRDPGLLYCIGYATWQRHKADRHSERREDARRLLERARQASPHRSEAYLRLAETWIEDNMPQRAFEWYARAFDADPADPEALCGFVRYKISQERDLSFLLLLRPTILAAAQKCRAQVDARVNLPWAFYHLGELSLLLGPRHENEALTAYLQAIAGSTSAHMIEQALERFDLLETVEAQLPLIGAVRRLLVLGRAIRFSAESPDLRRRLAEQASRDLRSNTPALVIVAGGCDPSVQERMEEYRPLLLEAFQSFSGTIFSGGTREGISGIIGEIGAVNTGRIRTVAYLPRVMPTDGSARPDDRYHERRYTSGTGFSVLEPLQCWIDLLATGVRPAEVRILGINGGNIAGFEYRLALLLGAKVGLVRDSGRKVRTFTSEAEVDPIPGLAILPADRMTLQAFLAAPPKSVLSSEQRLMMARQIHEYYLEKNPPIPVTLPQDPAHRPWEQLDPQLKEANVQQAEDHQRKLAAIGKCAVPVQGRPIRCLEFTPEEVELLAEMEHGRWVAQKLLAGWILGPRDDAKRQRPSLVAWRDLSEVERKKDRDAVTNLPRLLEELGFEIQRLPDACSNT